MRTVQWQTIVLLATAAVSGWLLLGELEARRAVASGELESPTIGLHGSTQTARLMQCDAALAPMQLAFLPGRERTARAAACRRTAEAVLRANSWHGLAAYVVAASADILHEPDLREAMLSRSARDAPFESWLAERRTFLALASGLPPQRGDLQTLLTTQSGAEFLARRFGEDAALPSHLAPALDGASSDDVVRFANLLRREHAR